MKPMLILPILFAALVSPMSAYADDRQDREKENDKPALVILPPIIRTQQNAERSDKQVNPNELMPRVLPRMEREAEKKKWPVRIINPPDIEAVYLSVAAAPRDPSKEYKFGFLKPIAEKVNARYLVSFAINELTGYRTTNTFQAMTKARTQIDLFVYDRETDEYVWQKSEKSESARGSFANAGSIGQRLDQAMVNALTRALEPFAKGERKKIGRPTANVIASVQRTLAEGKKVLLDVGKGQNVSVGDVFKSVESDAEIKVIEVLENGSIAEVVTGAPKEKEVFKPRQP